MNNIKISNIIVLFLTCLTLFHHGLCIIAASETVVLLKSVNNNNDKFEKLNIFLSSLTVTIPTVQLSIDFQGSPVTILLQDLICTDLSLSSISVRSNENVGMTKVSTNLNLQDVQITCNSKYIFTIAGSKDIGNLEANSTNSNIELGIDLIKNSNDNYNTNNPRKLLTVKQFKEVSSLPPNLFNISTCISKIKVDELKFTGNLEYLAEVIKKQLNTMVNPAICNKLMILSENITSILQNVSHIIIRGGENNNDENNWKKKELEILKTKQLLSTSNNNNDNNVILSNLKENLFIKFVHIAIEEFFNVKVCGLPIAINKVFQNMIDKGKVPNALNISLPNIPLLISPPLLANNTHDNDNNTKVNLNITLTSIQIIGLNTFTNFSMFQPISKYTMNHTFELDHLQISIGVQVLETETPYPHHEQNVLVTFAEFQNVKIELSTLLALDAGYLGKVPLIALWKHLQGCSIRGVRAFDLTSIDMSFGKIIGKPVTISGMISSNVDNILNTLITSITTAYEASLFSPHTEGLANIMAQIIFPILNNAIEKSLDNFQQKSIEEHEVCNSSAVGPRPSDAKPLDFSQTFPIIILSGLIENILFPMLNDILANSTCGINGEHGRLDMKNFLVGPHTIHVQNYDKEPQVGNVTIGLSNLTVENINTFSKLKAFDTFDKQPTRLDSEIRMAPNSNIPLRISVDVTLKVKRLHTSDDDEEMKHDVDNTFRIGFSLNNLTFMSDFIVAIDSYDLAAMPLLATNSLNCWIGLLNDFQILHGLTALNASIHSFDLTCSKEDSIRFMDDHLSCNSPSFPDWIKRSKNQKYVEDFEEFVGNGTTWVLDKFTTDQFKTHMLKVLKEKQDLGFIKCYETPWFPPDPEFIYAQCIPSKTIMFIYSTICGLMLFYFGTSFFVNYFQVEHARERCLCNQNRCCGKNGCCGCSCVECCRGKCRQCQTCFNIFCCTRLFCKDIRNETLGNIHGESNYESDSYNPYSLLSGDNDSTLLVDDKELMERKSYLQRKNSKRYEKLNLEIGIDETVNGEALLYHSAIPKNVRYGMLVLIFVNICLFFTDHALTAAHVDIHGKVLGDDYYEKEAFPFGLGYSLVNLWNACAVVLVGFMATFSGAWPYLKLLLMTALWCAPPALLSPKLRGKYFHWLDVFGKWSLIDLYVLVNAMVAFYVTIDSPDLEILPPKFYHMQIISRPVYGLYSFCFAVILSLLLSHVQVIYHLNAVTADEWEKKMNGKMRSIEQRLIRSNNNNDVDNNSNNVVNDNNNNNNISINQEVISPNIPKSWLDVGSNDTALMSVAEISFSSIQSYNNTSPDRRSSINQDRRRIFEGINFGRPRSYSMVNNKSNLLNMNIIQSSKYSVGVLIVLSIILLLIGSIIPGWTFVTHGIAGLLGEFGVKGSTVRPFSLLTAFFQLINQSTQGSGFIGTTFIALIYIGFGFIIPLLQLLGLFVLWYKRMSLYMMKKLYLGTQILSAFAALEVWLLGTIFTVYQIKFISYSVLDEQCTFLKPTFKTLVNFGFIVPDDGNCFQIDGVFHWYSFIIMFIASLITYFISHSVIQEAGYAIVRREEVALKSS